MDFAPSIDYSVCTKYGDRFEFLTVEQQESLNAWIKERFGRPDPITRWHLFSPTPRTPFMTCTGARE
jgi:hypothetical protein